MRKPRLTALFLCVILAAALAFAPAVSAGREPADGQSGSINDLLYGGDSSEIADETLREFISSCSVNNATDELKYVDLYAKSYDVEMRVNADRSISVTETVQIMFNTEMHGFYRTIPYSGGEENYILTLDSVEGAPYTTSDENDDLVIKMGDADKSVEGLHLYRLRYTIRYFDDVYEGYDRIYQNLFPSGLEMPVQNATARVILPEGAALSDYLVYFGEAGSAATDSKHLKSHFHGGTLYIFTSEILSSHEGATIDLKLADGIFDAPEPEYTVRRLDAAVDIDRYGSFVATQDITVEVSNRFDTPGAQRAFVVCSLLTGGYDSDRDLADQHIEVTRDGETLFAGERGFCEIPLGDCSVGDVVELKVVHTGSFVVFGSAMELNVRYTPVFSKSGYVSRGSARYDDLSVRFGLPSAGDDAVPRIYCSKGHGFSFDVSPSDSGFCAALTGAPFVNADLSLYPTLPPGSVTRRTTAFDYLGVILGLLLAAAALLFRFTKKEPSLIPTMEFRAPDRLNPAEVGFIIDGKSDSSDITSLIFYWASHRHLRLEITAKDCYVLHRLSPLDELHEDYEAVMFDKLWEYGAADDRVSSEELNERFYTQIDKTKAELAKKYTGDKQLATSASKNKSGYLCLAAILIVALTVGIGAVLSANSALEILGLVVFLLSFAVTYLLSQTAFAAQYSRKPTGLLIASGASAVVGSLLFSLISGGVQIGFIPLILLSLCAEAAAFIAPWIVCRSEYGNAVLGRCVGFRQFLITAEKDKLQALLADSPEYFYDILPYANVLGVSKLWSDKFEGLSIQTPDWVYSSDPSIIANYLLLSHAMTSLNKSMVSIPHASGSGSGGGGMGSFGGGSVGGGGGGGGGGGW